MMHSKYIVTPLRMEDEEETSKDEKQEAVSPGMMKKMEKMFFEKEQFIYGALLRIKPLEMLLQNVAIGC
jgi:hypothetical protein